MTTFFKSVGSTYEEKMGDMTVFVNDGGNEKKLGGCPVNWAEFAESKKH